jgi:leader peptidase (prepilin peptidase)/N-methyltransferase
VPELPAIIAASIVGTVAGVVLQSRLVRVRYRLDDERSRPRPSTFWVIPVTAVVTALTWIVIAPGRPTIVPVTYVLATWVMVVLAFIDLDVHRLPNKIQLPAYPVLLGVLVVCTVATGEWQSLGRAVLAGAALLGLYVALAFIAPAGGMGFGDVKLAGLLGGLLGWLSWGHVIIATMLTFLIGGAVAAALLVVQRADRRTEFAYGPAMLLGAVLTLGSPLVLRALV